MMQQSLSLKLLLLALLVIGQHEVLAADWDHKDNGQSWAQKFPQFCAGRKQSPIDLGVGKSQHDSELKPWVIQAQVNGSYELTVQNNGHGLVISWSPQLSIQMGVSDSTMYFTAAQLHWHWGSDDNKGSEHTVDGVQYPLEGHMVFYNSHDYPDISTAMSSVNGLAVLGVFYELGSADNELFKLIESAMGKVQAKDAKEVLNDQNANIKDLLLPSNQQDFYRYEGSLTTPMCHETVLWTVFKQPVSISSRQLRLLREMKDGAGQALVDNFRLPQPLNSRDRPGSKRQLYRTFSSATAARPAYGIVLTAVALVVMVTAGGIGNGERK